MNCVSLANVTLGPKVTSLAQDAFANCTNLTAVYVQGNAPGADSTAFESDGLSIIYRVPGTTGWGTTFGGRPVLPITTQIQIGGASFGVQTNQFGFNTTGSYGLNVVVEAATDLAHPVWTPMATNTLSGTSSYFSDPQWTNYPKRFYRVRWP